MSSTNKQNQQTNGQRRRPSSLRRLTPKARPPIPSALQKLPETDRALLDARLGETAECVYYGGFRNVTYRRLTPATACKAAPEVPADGAPLPGRNETTLFLHFNYCRHRVMQILRAHHQRRLRLAAARELIRWERAADALRTRLVHANVALVKAMARRFGSRTIELPELISEGNVTLLRCVDRFDAARGFKFSTYACQSLLTGYARYAARVVRERKQTPVSYDPAFERGDQTERERTRVERDLVQELGTIMAANSADLTNTEQQVLSARFALDRCTVDATRGNGQTLHKIGATLGISKERVRQIQCRALGKLRGELDGRLAPAG